MTIPPIDGSEISEQELYWVDDAGELVPAVQGDGVGSSTWRIDLYDLPGQVESIQLQLIDDDGAVPIQDEYPVQWISSVCNRCSGRPSCSDELAHTANIEVVLD